jgi:ubiquinone/menaquinone biosynthesis C-methylase UbiE
VSDSTPATDARSVAQGFTESASDYEDAVRYNLDGVRRLVASIPEGDYREVLDVGCGTGWSSLTFIARFGPSRVIGLDPSAGMLDVFRGHAESLEGIDVDLVEAEVMDMPVPEESVDAVICTMAMHWFPDKAGAVREMARRLRPGGVLAVLAGGEGVEEEYRRILLDMVPPVPEAWPAVYETAPTGEREMLDYLGAAGLEPQDVWIERRFRQTPVDDFLERMRVVAGHLSAGMDPDELEAHQRRIRDTMLATSGSKGFEYHFCKLFAVARKPD